MELALQRLFWLAENENVDVMEFYTSSMRLSSAFANATAKVGPLVDLRLDFDLSDQKGQSQAWSRLLSHSPSVLVLSPFGQPPASRVGVSASGKVTKKGLKELSDKLDSRKNNKMNICEAQLAFCLRAAWHQLEHGRSFIWLMDVHSPQWITKAYLLWQSILGGSALIFQRLIATTRIL